MKFIHLLRCNISYIASEQMVRVMKVFIIIMTVFLVQVSASTNAQVFTMKGNNVDLKQVFINIRKQTGYTVLYETALIRKAKRVNVDFVQAKLADVLAEILIGQNLEYEIKKKAIIIIEKDQPSFLEKAALVIQDAAKGLLQSIDVSGLVLDEKGQPLVGATVKVKGSNRSIVTDKDGKFYLSGVDDEAVLVITYVGYEDREVGVNWELTVVMQERSKDLEEVVVAYGKTTQQALTGAVTVVKGEQIATLPNRSFDKSLQGLVPGLQITGGTGQPGGGVSSMVHRGISTAGSGIAGSTVRNPLIVIDGIPVTQDAFQNRVGAVETSPTNPLAQINPSEIESISVLRDAAAIALYGSKAGNGVILVTTKTGKRGKTIFGYRSQVDLSYLPKRNLHNIPTQEEYLQMLYNTYRNTTPGISDQTIRNDLYTKFSYRILGTDTTFYPAPDLSEELYENAATTFINEVSMSGGNEKSKFYINIGSTSQNGIVKNTSYDRTSLRINFSNKPVPWLDLGTNTMLSYNVQRSPNGSEGASSFGLVSTLSPLNPIRNDAGAYILSYPWGGAASATATTLNPRAVLEYNVSKNKASRAISKMYAEAAFFKYFKLNSSVGIDYMLAEVMDKTDPRFRAKSSVTGGEITDYDKRTANVIMSNTLNADIPFKKNHAINITLGQEAQIITRREIGGVVTGDSLALSIYDQLTSPRYTTTVLRGNANRQTLLSYFGNLNYSFIHRYYLSGSIRKDGSSRFGARELWGNFWSGGAGWIISKEPWMKIVEPFVSYLKLRGSIGVAGSSGAMNPSSKYDALSQSTYADRTSFRMESQPGNPDIRWEKTFSWNAGLEARFVLDRIWVNLDMYNKKTTDLINSIPLSTLSGSTLVDFNIGDLSNRGIEMSVSGTIIQQRLWKWSIDASLSKNKNVLVKSLVPFSNLNIGNLANEEGRNYNSFYLRQWAGVNPLDGKPQWIDANGQPTSVYNSGVQVFVGKPQPDGFGAFSTNLVYKGIGLNVQFLYQYGVQVINNKMMQLVNDGVIPYANQSIGALNYWRKPGDIAPNPRRIINNADGGRNVSTRHLFDADYIKLSNMTLSYTFGPDVLQHIHLKQLKISVMGNNLAIWTKLSDQDPDNANMSGGIGSPYPNAQSFSFNLQAGF